MGFVRPHPRQGFTLVELMAVMILMGILAALAVPKFYEMQLDAHRTTLANALAEATARFDHAYLKYITDNHDAPAAVTDLAVEAYLGPGATTTGIDMGDFTVTWKRQDDQLVIEIIAAKSFANHALAALKSMAPDPTRKAISGVVWGGGT